MTAYFIANLKIHDEAGMAKYREAFRANFAKFEGKVLAADPQPQKTEGEWPYNRSVILEFPSKDEALRWYNDPEYQEIAKLRHAAAGGDAAVIVGLE